MKKVEGYVLVVGHYHSDPFRGTFCGTKAIAVDLIPKGLKREDDLWLDEKNREFYRIDRMTGYIN
jgi:hypothetical protein